MLYFLMRYYQFRWNEGNDIGWGDSTHFYEIGDDGCSRRQIEVYDNGTVLKYDENHPFDEYGMLADFAHNPGDEITSSETIEITVEEFEKNWASHKALNQI
jgi:hypothetical protein